MEKKETRLSVRVEPEFLEQIKNFAASQNQPYSEFVIAALQAAMGQEGLTLKALAERVNYLEHRLNKIDNQVA